jgi:hypothetical protein
LKAIILQHMILNYKNIVTACLIFMVLCVSAKAPDFKHKNGGKGRVKATSAACNASSKTAQLTFNNVAARLNNGGTLWNDGGNRAPAYAVPKGSVPATHAIYAGALWMGGEDLAGNLKVAASTFGSSPPGFWPGPLNIDGTAEITSDECLKWDKMYVTSKAEVYAHQAHFSNLNVPYETPNGITDWPAYGGFGKDYYVAPFFDADNDGEYDPEKGDYPGYDLVGNVECRSNERFVPLFGDTTVYWVFNDKGGANIAISAPIGMEIRAQAFSFSSEDEINNMTFYNYVLINQGSQVLTNTYFGQWVDADLGNPQDDYVGCDATLGLGFCYNGDENDDGPGGYGSNPPAIGVDFFEGPFQDNDYLDSLTGELYSGEQRSIADKEYDNPLTDNAQDAYDSLGIPYIGLGIGYGDGIGNNERFGMRKFIYYNNGNDPVTKSDYYGYLQGNWTGGTNMRYGGDGNVTATGPKADFMFPGKSDVLGFGTGGDIQGEWSERETGGVPNQPSDRRFLQSSGPFTLNSGDVNNITVGVVYGRSNTGGALESVRAMKVADKKAQTLFDNCFQILEGPDAPDITIKESDKELIIYITNPESSNNHIEFNEDYVKKDPKAIVLDDNDENELTKEQQSYIFQGYKVYQLKHGGVSIADVNEPALARLIYQCDIKDSITKLINYTIDEEIKLPIPELMIDGVNEGIKHTFRVTTDQFAKGNNLLVNHKTYHFVAVAYASNQYQEYDPVAFTGQAVQYLSSRKNGRGGAIQAVSAIPHKLKPNQQIQVSYGEGIAITRVEGRGNEFNSLKITEETRLKMFHSPNGLDTIPYEVNGGPITVQIVDPLSVAPGKYEINVIDPTITGTDPLTELDDALFEIVRKDFNGAILSRDTTGAPLAIGSELYYQDFGIAISLKQYSAGPPIYSDKFALPSANAAAQEGYSSYAISANMLESEMVFADNNNQWLRPLTDQEDFSPQNWILSGSFAPGIGVDTVFFRDIPNVDPNDDYENIIQGSWAPFNIVAAHNDGPVASIYNKSESPNKDLGDGRFRFEEQAYTINYPNVDIIITSDTAFWTRSVVIEAGVGASATKGFPRNAPSVDKMGNTGTPEANLTSAVGMGWFPGYAVDIETGDRLNIAFSEDSRLIGGYNGDDMLYNPTNAMYNPIPTQQSINYYGGGKHYIYIFRNVKREIGGNNTPAYDLGKYSYNTLSRTSNTLRKAIWSSCAWVGLLGLNEDYHFENAQGSIVEGKDVTPLDIRIVDKIHTPFSSDVRISLRLARPYQSITTGDNAWDSVQYSHNNWNPKYLFEIPESYKMNTTDVANATDEVKNEILDIISIVPNPYYSYSGYETGKLDTRVKFSNLPEVATIKIFTTNGTLVKTINKDSDLSYIDWNLTNEVNIPISSGTYIIHINVPGVGEKVIKWFGVMRKPAIQQIL